MNDYSLRCNILKCQLPLNETAWVLRCMHVFCPGHGQAYFSNSSPQISCPICNEINLKEVDILLCEVNPSDMILTGIAPEKAIHLASKSIRLWWFQIQQQHCLINSKLNTFSKKYNHSKHYYGQILNKIKQKYEAEIEDLKTNRQSLLKRMEEIVKQLEKSKKELSKFKNAYYHDQNESPNSFKFSSSSHWLNDADLL